MNANGREIGETAKGIGGDHGRTGLKNNKIKIRKELTLNGFMIFEGTNFVKIWFEKIL